MDSEGEFLEGEFLRRVLFTGSIGEEKLTPEFDPTFGAHKLVSKNWTPNMGPQFTSAENSSLRDPRTVRTVFYRNLDESFLQRNRHPNQERQLLELSHARTVAQLNRIKTDHLSTDISEHHLQQSQGHHGLSGL